MPHNRELFFALCTVGKATDRRLASILPHLREGSICIFILIILVVGIVPLLSFRFCLRCCLCLHLLLSFCGSTFLRSR